MRRQILFERCVQCRLRMLFYILIFLYACLALRLIWIQVIRAPYFAKKAEYYRLKRFVLHARRGTIYDRNGVKLAVNVQAYDIGAHPKKIAKRDRPKIAAQLAKILGCSEKFVLSKLSNDKAFVYIKRGVNARAGLAIKEAKLPQVEVTPLIKRVYPAGGLAANVIGFTNIDGKGIEGLEKAYDKFLRGKDGYIIAEVDARGRIIPGTIRQRVEPVDGMDIILTIDSTLQHNLEMELRKAYNDRRAAGASAVMIDPKTGEIMALANMPTFDPQEIAASSAAARRNRAITDLYEPGSTLKTVTCSAALNEKVIDLDDTFYCRGSMGIGNHVIHCSLHGKFKGGHGQLNVAKVLQHSCNVGAASIGLKLGPKKLYQYEKAFGLFDKPGTGMVGEMSGWAGKWQDWPDIKVANIAFGQGIAVTPLQLAQVYAAIANHGIMMRPHIVKEIRRPDGKPFRVFHPKIVRRVVTEETADLIAEMLHGVVSGGTGKSARVEGYRVAGKTGTAQKPSTVGRGYAAGKYVASFVGFLPVTNPRAVILIAVDEPKDTQFGAVAAAPVFREVARKAMWYMKVPPDDLPNSPPVANRTKGREANGKQRSG
ncbi:MAG: penicillin-binding protein 2 [Armatimonadetes bacterium]|nr:penicillin-binding protein 2 [Armatimonadota bacterium]